MKTCLVVFYSRTGITQKVANEIAKAADCDLEQIRDVKPRTGWLGYLRSGYEVMTEHLPAIQPVLRNPADYDLVILGTPVWVDNISAPMRRYIADNKNRFNRIATFCTMGGSQGNQALSTMAKLCEKQPIAQLSLNDKQIESQQHLDQVANFVKSLAAEFAH